MEERDRNYIIFGLGVGSSTRTSLVSYGTDWAVLGWVTAGCLFREDGAEPKQNLGQE